MNLINNTPLTAATYFLMDREGAEVMLLVLKGVWRISEDGTLTVADEPVRITSELVYRGEPGKSSLIYETDIVMGKPGTDCVLNGHARPAKPNVMQMDVSFGVGQVIKKVRVFGERRWEKRMVGGASMSKPLPIEQVPLVWENAFGGIDASRADAAEHELCQENPVGRGFVAKKSDLDIDGRLLPNIEDHANLIRNPRQRPTPAGFGLIAPHWKPRTNYTGTYDERWRKYLSPLLPEDFDPRFYLAATPGLSTPTHLKGTERVFVEGASARGQLLFDLPGIAPRVIAHRKGCEGDLPVNLDTVMVEPDHDRVTLTWRGIWNVHGHVHEVISVRVET